MATLAGVSYFGVMELLMTSGHDAVSQDKNPGSDWLTTLASLVVGAAFLGLWFWLLPSWLGFRGPVWRGALAVDCGHPVGTGLRGGLALRLGFRTDGPRNARADCSPAEAGGGGILPLCAEPDVCGILRGLDGTLGDLWAGQPGGDHCGGHRCGGSSPLCAVLRGADAAKEVRRGV